MGCSSWSYLTGPPVHHVARTKVPLLITAQFSITHRLFTGLRDFRDYLTWLPGSRISVTKPKRPSGFANGTMVWEDPPSLPCLVSILSRTLHWPLSHGPALRLLRIEDTDTGDPRSRKVTAVAAKDGVCTDSGNGPF